MTQKYVTLYSYVNLCFKSLSKIMLFSNPLKVIYEFFSRSKNIVKHWLQWLINVFENSNFIIFIANYYTCFHNILETLSSKCTKEMCNINIFLTQKHEKQSTGYSSYGSYICECTHFTPFFWSFYNLPHLNRSQIHHYYNLDII